MDLLHHWLYNPKHELSRLKERILMWIAWHIPRKIAYWCTIRVIQHAAQGEWEEQEVPELLAMDILPRWRPVRPIYPPPS